MENKINVSSNPEIDRSTRSYFNDLAADWEKKQAIDDKKLLGLLSRLHFSGAKRIMDLGCGTGVLLPYLRQLADPNAQILALDFAEHMVFEADKRANSRIHLLCSDIHHLPVREKSIDIIIAFQVFPHVKNKDIALLQCWEALRENGEFAIIHLQGSQQLNTFHASLNDAVAGHELPSAAEMKGMLQKHNFEIMHWMDEPEEYFVSGKKKVIR